MGRQPFWDTHGISGNVFANPHASSSAPYPQELNPWGSHFSEPIHSSPAGKKYNQTPVQDQRCQSGPSAKDSVIFTGGGSLKNYGADQQRLQISDLHFGKFPRPATFACWKIFKRRISLEEPKAQKQDRFLRGGQIAYLIYDYFGVTGIHDSVENYADLLTISLRNDDIQEFDSKWDGILLSMTKIPPDDILEGLYKLRIRESDKLKTVLDLHDLEIHQKKLGPDYHRLKTTVKRSIEQDLRSRILGTRDGNYERNALVKNQETKQRGQRILGDCWQWKANGQCVKGDNCSFRHDIDKRGKVTPSNPSPNSFMQQDEKESVENPKSQRKESQW